MPFPIGKIRMKMFALWLGTLRRTRKPWRFLEFFGKIRHFMSWNSTLHSLRGRGKEYEEIARGCGVEGVVSCAGKRIVVVFWREGRGRGRRSLFRFRFTLASETTPSSSFTRGVRVDSTDYTLWCLASLLFSACREQARRTFSEDQALGRSVLEKRWRP